MILSEHRLTAIKIVERKEGSIMVGWDSDIKMISVSYIMLEPYLFLKR
jgi:hypothetical protein